jgi:hypothetical protein
MITKLVDRWQPPTGTRTPPLITITCALIGPTITHSLCHVLNQGRLH